MQDSPVSSSHRRGSQDRIGRISIINMKRQQHSSLYYIVIICLLLSITPHVRCLSDGSTGNRRLSTTHDNKKTTPSTTNNNNIPRILKGSYIDDDMSGFLDDDIIEWDDEIIAPDDPVDIAQKYGGDASSSSSTISDGDDDDIIERIKDDNDDKSSSSRQRPPKATWYDVDVIPESVVKHDSILYDITMGFTFAAIFSLGMVVVACMANQCLTYLFCPHKLKKKKWRRRYRVEARGVGGMFIPMKDMHVYAPLSAADEDYDEDVDPEDVDDDPDRLEYGLTEAEFDDDDDYSFGAKRDGRYESEEIDKAAEDYFKKKEEEEEESDDEKEAAKEDLLDLEAMEKKIAQSMESSRFI